jgi:sulfur-oxidizing protein SoxX
MKYFATAAGAPVLFALAVLCACAVLPASADEKANANAQKVLKASFKEKGQAALTRLDQDETQAVCTRFSPDPPPAEAAKKILDLNQAAIRYPEDGKYLGSWKAGEKIAQEGRGLQYSDDPAQPSGGNCYACHQLTKTEIAYGTLGPSLAGYGKLRGNSEAVVQYTWAKLFDTKAFVPCSNMPRFGHMRILTEAQMKDVMALLLDPTSPVNE